jgi:hypothetical protein
MTSVSRRLATSSKRRSGDQPELPLAPAPTVPRGLGVDPEEAAKVAVARRAKPGAPPGQVRLVLTLELRRALAEQLSAKVIRSGKNLEAVVIDMLEAGGWRASAARRWCGR